MLGHELAEKEEEMRELALVRSNMQIPLFQCFPWSAESIGNGKVIHFVRHGRGQHNEWASKWKEENREGNPYVQPECPVDAELVHQGRLDAENAGKILRQRLGGRQVLALVSPMRRTIQTCLIADESGGNFIRKIRVNESLRERFGVHVCDTLGDYDRHQLFPRVDWGDMYSAADDPALLPVREPYSDLLERGVRFCRYVLSLPDEEVVVFSHSSFLLSLFRGVFTLSDELLLGNPFLTGEVRSVVLVHRPPQ